jgi:hypothetical protein
VDHIRVLRTAGEAEERNWIFTRAKAEDIPADSIRVGLQPNLGKLFLDRTPYLPHLEEEKPMLRRQVTTNTKGPNILLAPWVNHCNSHSAS